MGSAAPRIGPAALASSFIPQSGGVVASQSVSIARKFVFPHADEELSTPSPTLTRPSPSPKIHPYPGSSLVSPAWRLRNSSQDSRYSSSCLAGEW